jgi:dynactin 1
MASAPVDIPIGAIVDISLGRGVVRFCGTTSFSSGKWVGVELSGPVGKNDGSVQGVAYFSCQMHYGVFVKPSQVKIVDLPSSGTVSLIFPFLAIIGHANAHP